MERFHLSLQKAAVQQKRVGETPPTRREYDVKGEATTLRKGLRLHRMRDHDQSTHLPQIHLLVPTGIEQLDDVSDTRRACAELFSVDKANVMIYRCAQVISDEESSAQVESSPLVCRIENSEISVKSIERLMYEHHNTKHNLERANVALVNLGKQVRELTPKKEENRQEEKDKEILHLRTKNDEANNEIKMLKQQLKQSLEWRQQSKKSLDTLRQEFANLKDALSQSGISY